MLSAYFISLKFILFSLLLGFSFGKFIVPSVVNILVLALCAIFEIKFFVHYNRYLLFLWDLHSTKEFLLKIEQNWLLHNRYRKQENRNLKRDFMENNFAVDQQKPSINRNKISIQINLIQSKIPFVHKCNLLCSLRTVT